MDELPERIERKCCESTISCGNTQLRLNAKKDLITGEEVWAYVRDSNDDPYYSAGTRAELIEKMQRGEPWSEAELEQYRASR